MRPLYLVPLLSLSACVVHETAPQPTTTSIVTPAPAPTATVLAPAPVIVPTGHDHNAISCIDEAFAEPTH